MNALGLQLKELLASSKNLQAFLRVVREGESSQDDVAYRTMFGNKLFDDFSKHPRKAVRSKFGWTSAAGAYQFMAAVPGRVKTDTWTECQRALALDDFSPESQDVAAVYLIKRRRALEDAVAGRLVDAISKCRLEWASLPGSPYGQPVMTIQKAMEVFGQYGGEVAASAKKVTPAQDFDRDPTDLTTAAPVDAPTITAGVTPMPIPIFAQAALAVLMEIVPKLVRVFGSGTKVSDRNATAVEQIIEVAKAAVGARNEQDLVEVVKTDPAARDAVREAIEQNWFKIEEVGGGVQAAREANLVYARESINFWHNPAFTVSAMLFLLPLIMVCDVFLFHPDTYDDNLRTQVVTGVLLIVSMIGAYWLGTSHSSARKTDILGEAINPGAGNAPPRE